MPDNSLDILIRTLAETHGAEAVSKSLSKIKDESKQTAAATSELTDETKKTGEVSEEAGKKISIFGEHNKEVKKTIQELSREFPIAGLALRAFQNPIAAALTISVGFFVAIKRHIDETNRALDEFEAAGKQAIGATKDALNEFRLKIIETDEAFAKYQASVSEQSAKILSDIHAQHDALIEILDAEEAVAVARSDNPEKTKEEFRQIKAQLDLREKSQIIAEKEKELQEVIVKGGEKFAVAQANLRQATPESAKLALATIPATIASVDEMIKKETERQKGIDKTIPVDAMGRPLDPVSRAINWALPLAQQATNPEFRASEEKLSGMQRYRGGLQAEQERLTRGITAHGETETLGTTLRELTAELRRLNMGAAATGAAEPRRRMAALESQRQQFGAQADAAEAAGNWQAFTIAAKGMDRTAAAMDQLTLAVRNSDAAAQRAMAVADNLRHH